MKILCGTILALLSALSAHGVDELAAGVVSDTNRFTCGSGTVEFRHK